MVFFVFVVLCVFILAALAPATVVALVLGQLTRPLRIFRRGSFTAWTYGGIGMLCAAFVTYSIGFWSDDMIDLTPLASDQCPDKVAPHLADTGWLMPLSHVCHYADGSTIQLVPVAINAVFVVALAGYVICLVAVLAILRDTRIRRAR